MMTHVDKRVGPKRAEGRGHLENEGKWMMVLFLLPVVMSLLVGFVGLVAAKMRYVTIWLGSW